MTAGQLLAACKPDDDTLEENLAEVRSQSTPENVELITNTVLYYRHHAADKDPKQRYHHDDQDAGSEGRPGPDAWPSTRGAGHRCRIPLILTALR